MSKVGRRLRSLTQKGPYGVQTEYPLDELYNLDADPWELHNLAEDPEHKETLIKMAALMWRYVRDTGDHALLNTHYPILRLAPIGPEVLDRQTGIARRTGETLT